MLACTRLQKYQGAKPCCKAAPEFLFGRRFHRQAIHDKVKLSRKIGQLSFIQLLNLICSIVKRKSFTESKVLSNIKQYEGGRAIDDLCRENSISKATLYN